MARTSHWCFTSYADTAPEFDPDLMTYMCYQHEICPTTSRLHTQGYVQFNNRIRRKTAKLYLGDDTIHLESARGLPHENRAYCSKPDSAVADTFVEFGTMHPGQGTRTDLHAAKDFIADTANWHTVVLDDTHLCTVARHLNWSHEVFNATRPTPLISIETFYTWQIDLLSDICGDPDPRQIIWIHDSIGGTGKSTMARYLVSNHGAIILSGQKRDIHYAYTGQRIAIFDVARAASEYIPYEAMEDIKNGFFFCEKYSSGMKTYPTPHVIVFANVPPAAGKLSADRIDLRESDRLIFGDSD